MPDIFMHFIFRRWFTHRPAAWQPPPPEQAASQPPPRTRPDPR